jgi:hypothetical protein
MIRIIYSETPAGNYWLEYDRHDSRMVDHLLAGAGWSPSIDEVNAFVELAKAHGIRIAIPTRRA